MRIAVLVITGSMGSGKTTVLGEASDILSAANVAHAAIDVDALGIYHPPTGDDLEIRNVAEHTNGYLSPDRRVVPLGVFRGPALRVMLAFAPRANRARACHGPRRGPARP